MAAWRGMSARFTRAIDSRSGLPAALRVAHWPSYRPLAVVSPTGRRIASDCDLPEAVIATSCTPQVVASPMAPVPASASVVCLAAATEAPEEAVAFLRYSRGSALKVRRVLDQIRGRSYEEALMILEYMPYQACEPVIKTLLSAAANAKNNLGMKKKDLYVSECFADEGPVMKRFRPRAQGRANRILKPTVHITVKVAEREE